MQSLEHWNNEFKSRIAEAVGKGVSYDMNKIITDLVEDVQNDALGLQPIVRPKYGIITKAEAEATASGAQGLRVQGTEAVSQGQVKSFSIDGTEANDPPQ